MLFHPTIYVKHNDFRIYPPTKIISTCNEILCHDKVLTKTYKSQISESFLSAILHRLICPLPSKFIREPFYAEKVLTLDCCMLHCKKSSLQLSNPIISIFNLAINQTGKIDSILLRCIQNLVSSQIHIVEPKHNSPKIMEPYTNHLKVDDISGHMERQCISSQFIWIFVLTVV